MKKSLLFIFLSILGLGARSQINCSIYPGDTTVCYGERINLYTEFSDTLKYYWHHSGETTVIVAVDVYDTTTYYLTVYNSDSSVTCTDSITISTYPRMVVDFTQINKGCPDECKAQVKAEISEGFPPYRYLWNAKVAPNDSTVALGLCSEREYIFRAIDTICSFDSAFYVEGYDMPEIEITVSPDTLYYTNPRATFSFENKSADSIPLTNWSWKFTDDYATNEMSPTYVFSHPDTIEFIYTTIDGCVDTVEIPIELKEAKLEIYNVFTPNGDGRNDTWKIPNLELYYVGNELIIFNRWGKKVFEANNYTGNWDGGSLPDGVYYYILRCDGYFKEDVFKGAVTIIGSNR